jgi:hypothetical protein
MNYVRKRTLPHAGSHPYRRLEWAGTRRGTQDMLCVERMSSLIPWAESGWRGPGGLQKLVRPVCYMHFRLPVSMLRTILVCSLLPFRILPSRSSLCHRSHIDLWGLCTMRIQRP